MEPRRSAIFVRFAALLVALAAGAQIGCAWLGPRSIRSARADYNDAVTATDAEQLLGTIVRVRYGEPSSLLAVSSITASMHFTAMGGAEFGVGRASNYAGNLTPLSAGASFEENPTISYTPVQGEKYLRQLLAPVPLDVALLLLGAFENSPDVMRLLLRSVNGIQNGGLLPDAAGPGDERFERLADALATLAHDGHVEWVQHTGATPGFALLLEGEGDRYRQQLAALHELLGLATPRRIGRATRIPIATEAGRDDGIRLRTRSLYELFAIAAASVEVPAEERARSVGPALPENPSAAGGIYIHCSEDEPTNAMTAVERRGYWYWIDANDADSKLVFRMLSALMSVQMSDAANGDHARPLLTVPVSR